MLIETFCAFLCLLMLCLYVNDDEKDSHHSNHIIGEVLLDLCISPQLLKVIHTMFFTESYNSTKKKKNFSSDKSFIRCEKHFFVQDSRHDESSRQQQRVKI